jgi:hypothetical protein
MARDIDVYQLVRAFAHKNGLTAVDYSVFAHAVQRQAGGSDQSEPLYRDLAINPDSVLVPRLYRLAKDKRLTLELVGGELVSIVLPEHFTDAFFTEYKRMEETPDLPFPDEEGLKLSVPPEWIQPVNLDTDLAHISDQETKATVPLYRLIFPGGIKSIVVPESFVPDKLLEYAMLKIRYYLRQGANREYIQNKLLYAFANKEAQLKDALGAVLTKPFEAIAEMKSSKEDFIYPFWAHLTSHVKLDLEKKQDKSAEDLAMYQAALLCEFYSGYYKGKAKRLIDLENAFRGLEVALRKPPYHFGLDDISGLRDNQGQPIQGRISVEDIEAFLRRKTTESENGGLPSFFVVATGQGRRVYIAKDRIFPLFFKLLGEARGETKNRFVGQWARILEDFRSSPAIDNDDDFRKELSAFIESRFPLLDAILKDRLLPLVHDEMAASGEVSADIARLFYRDELLAIDELLDLNRKALGTDARMLLPVWYSIPLFSAVLRFIRRHSRAKAPTSSAPQAPKPRDDSNKTLKERRAAFAAAAAAVEAELVPSGYSLDEFLDELEGRWNNLLNPTAKADLREDVNSLVRDYFRNVIRTMKPSGVSTERIKSMASHLSGTPSLLKIKNHSALEQYVQLYMLKLLKH